jgi:predicted RNase H-like HicB family nuclease
MSSTLEITLSGSRESRWLGQERRNDGIRKWMRQETKAFQPKRFFGDFVHARGRQLSMKNLKILVEQHSDGYVAYPLEIKGVVVGQGDTYEEALADVESAVLFHVETFGEEVLRSAEPTSPSGPGDGE